MSLHDSDGFILNTKATAESLPDPTTVPGRVHLLVNETLLSTTWSSVGALPFFEGVPVTSITVPAGEYKEVHSDGVRWVVFSPSPVTPNTDSGFAVLGSAVVLPAAGGYIDSGLSVALPRAGTYHLDANVRTSISGLVAINVNVSARLFNVTAGAVVPNSEIIANNLFLTGVAVLTFGNDNTASIHVEHPVPGPATIRLELDRTDIIGLLTTSSIESDAAGRTTLRYHRVHD